MLPLPKRWHDRSRTPQDPAPPGTRPPLPTNGPSTHAQPSLHQLSRPTSFEGSDRPVHNLSILASGNVSARSPPRMVWSGALGGFV